MTLQHQPIPVEGQKPAFISPAEIVYAAEQSYLRISFGLRVASLQPPSNYDGEENRLRHINHNLQFQNSRAFPLLVNVRPCGQCCCPSEACN